MKSKQKVESVRRERTKAGTLKMKGGKGVFDESGKLKIPDRKKTVEEQMKVVESQVPLVPIRPEIQKVIDIEYCKVQNVREELVNIYNDLTAINGVVLNNSSGDTTVTYVQGNQKRWLMAIIPLKSTFSVMLENGITTRGWTREKVLAKVHELIDALKLPANPVNA